ncbi:MAG: family 78 glycoside hydrolase catalytic domain [Dysgonamonadaceae bacterium]|jgi:hypothetical protein|nr:family 78 glycoside hydrolase catalytic domain [Dysgonamonadaceae bacterium]
MLKIFHLFTFVSSAFICFAQPTGLTTDLIEHTDRVFLDGYPSTVSLAELGRNIERWQVAEIRNPRPAFGWVMNSDLPDTRQAAYRIVVATSPVLLHPDSSVLWDSGKTESDNSVCIVYDGEPLKPATVYYWAVKTWDNHGNESAFSAAKAFRTAATLDGATPRYPLQITDETPVNIATNNAGNLLVDFGRDAFGRLRLTLASENGGDTVTVHLGETLQGDAIDRHPGGTIRYSSYRLPLLAGVHTYTVKIRPDVRNTGKAAVKMPDYIGEVVPFRYCEIENYRKSLQPTALVRQMVHYPFDDNAACFHSSDTVLNMVWELCKYSMKATSFCGVFVDGDRERIPYEADAFINQLGYYAVAREYSIARNTNEYLLFNTTWPTEWFLHSVLMSWYDYLYTGNPESLRKYYYELKQKTLLALKEDNGLISTRTGKLTPKVKREIHANADVRDVVDWPQTGGFGAKGESDGFVFTDYNTVVNAFHYENLRLMSLIADELGDADDKAFYAKESERVKGQINKLLLDPRKGIYNDGIDTDHNSLHSNMLPLAFGIVPAKHLAAVKAFVRSRGMACSVYGSQYLLDAVYSSGEADYGLQLLTATDDRSWYNMIRVGSTISLEAWDNKYKPNQDWNHAWGAAPANIIPRRLMGIEPLEPGFRRIRICPQPSTLRHAEIRIPTVRGAVSAAFDNQSNKRFELTVEIPANMTAEVWLPAFDGKTTLTLDGKVVKKVKKDDGRLKVEVGSGKHRFVVEN